MSNKKTICHECKKPILAKEDLAVVGNSFIPYHNACFENIKHKNIYAFYSGYKSNGIFPWIMLIMLNSVIWSTFYFFNASFDEIYTFSLFISTSIILFRIISYLLHERHFR